MNGLIEPASIIISVVSTFLLLYREMKAIEGRMEKQYEKQAERTDKLYDTLMQESKNQAQRSDRLYEMFIALVKDKK